MPKPADVKRSNDESGASDGAGTPPELEFFPANQIEEGGWVVGVLKDLIAYTEHRELDEVAEALKEAHRIAARTILH